MAKVINLQIWSTNSIIKSLFYSVFEMVTVIKYCLSVYNSVAEDFCDASSTKRDDLHKEHLTDLLGHKKKSIQVKGI